MFKRLSRLAALIAFAIREWRTSDAPDTERSPYRGALIHKSPCDSPESHQAPSVDRHNPQGGA